ncbi:MAG TPA: hypothetical protein VH268_01485, partial [Solirubrobacterales bacterium]|nr:hypothetical protein [Solirubrobacterales bacterium]
QRSFFSPRDEVHPLLASLLDSAQHSLVLNMYGYDDDELDELIRGKLDSKHVYVQMSLDKSQAGGVHEKVLLKNWSNTAFGNSIAIGTDPEPQRRGRLGAAQRARPEPRLDAEADGRGAGGQSATGSSALVVGPLTPSRSALAARTV